MMYSIWSQTIRTFWLGFLNYDLLEDRGIDDIINILFRFFIM